MSHLLMLQVLQYGHYTCVIILSVVAAFCSCRPKTHGKNAWQKRMAKTHGKNAWQKRMTKNEWQKRNVKSDV
jgi:hypothetical protein